MSSTPVAAGPAATPTPAATPPASAAPTDTSATSAAVPAPSATPGATRPGRSSPTASPTASPAATLAVASAATTVALMNYTVPMLTLPDLAATFSTATSAQAWLLNGAPLGLAALLLVAGSLADDYGRRRLFLAGTLGLALTTALGALAGSTLTFTLARVAQGASSAAIIASSLGLLVHAFPPGPGRIRATGVWGAFVSAGIATGPLLAGWLGTYSWRLPYVVLAAAALAVTVLALRTLAESRSARGGRPDLLGAVVLGLAMTALLSALTLGRDGWLRTPVVLLLVAAAVLTGIFAAVERRGATPLIDPRLLGRRPFQAATSGALFSGLAVIGFFSYLPALLQRTLGISPLGAAGLFVTWSGTAFLVALQTRRLAGRVTARHQLALGFVLHAAGALAMLGAAASGSALRLVPGLVVAGVGGGLLNAALPRLSVESVPQERAAMGSGANNTARYIGSAAGVALMIAVATSASTPERGTDLAILVSTGLTLLGAALVLALRDGPRARG
ncbi:MFS transporter [Streptomyces sp. NBC_01498]|uniref:MFS transporter n=1 Tax=Streptomyces sp. NBC_01498 TaxID=2975870 RepID=UPI002E7B60BE|nr:MFS transporter [Streptomyces sp. NBC_01498]WTL26720.1 MFS transporter [Streptomyces sp. NBC_01498]